MSATRKPAPSEVGANMQSRCQCGHHHHSHKFAGEFPLGRCGVEVVNKGALCQCLCTQYHRAELGAPLQPGATQPEREGVAHEPAPMTAAHIPLGGSVEHRLYSKAELTALLERMARLVVQDAQTRAANAIVYHIENVYEASELSAYIKDAIAPLAGDQLLQQLREAVERT